MQTSTINTLILMRNITLTVLLLFFSLVLAAQNNSIDFLNEGDQLPAFKLETIDGQLISDQSLKGKTVVMVFFATWCPPCVRELPHVQQKIWERHGNNDQFRLLVIGREHSAAELKKFMTQNKYTFPVLADTERKLFSLFAKQNIPRTYLINNEGTITKMSTGFSEEKFNDLLAALEKMLQ